MPEDTGALVALGRPVRLANGETRMLRFTNRAVVGIEKLFGGTQKYMETIKVSPLQTTAETFALVFGGSPEAALDLLDARRLPEYLDAISSGLLEFFGIQPDEGEAKSQEIAGQSPGDDSSTRPWSPSESTRRASGTG